MHFLDIIERRYTGTPLSKKEWDTQYVIKMIREILKEFNLTYPAGSVIEFDEDIIRRFYMAGRALAVRSGIFDQDTERIIHFTEEEIDEAAMSQKKELTVGQKSDAYTFYTRRPEDRSVPGIVAGNPGCPMDEILFKATLESWAKESCINMVTCGSIVDVDGYAVRGMEPAELIAVRHELKYLNEVCIKVGRPYIGRLAAESSVSQIGDLGAMGPDGMRAGDAHLVCFNNELITNNDYMIRASNNIDTGVLNATLACVMVNGLAGNAAGAAVCMIASMLCANILYHVDYHLCHPIHMKYTATSTRECMWLQSVVNQAFSMCAPCIIIDDIYPKSGAGTKELLREVAANALVITTTGGHLEGVGSCDGLKPNCSGLEVRMMGAVGRAAAEQGITRKQADIMVRKLLGKYETVFDNGNEGLPFEKVYNQEHIEPQKFWLQMFEEVTDELKEMGLNI